MESKSWRFDVNVLLIFFVRDDVFSKTFAAVKEARPRRLLLFQDGAREGRADDIEGIRKCREIAMDIDWDCELYTNFQEANIGCDPATFYSHKWAFSLVDKCIILEDDCLPSLSFFPFCEELLAKYENDTRINRICGMNSLESSESCPYDYFFADAGSVWGWATWKRVADLWEEDYGFTDDSYSMKLLRQNKPDKTYTRVINKCLSHKKTAKPYWESINTYGRLLNSQLVIIPKYNLISNIGTTQNATHVMADIRVLPRRVKRLFFMKTFQYEFPLKSPKYVVCDSNYRKLIQLGGAKDKIESIWLRIRYGHIKQLWGALMRKLINVGK
ncbi:MAG: hemolysin activation protein [Rikenellaceae bacterium]